jgi:hypothetical protein
MSNEAVSDEAVRINAYDHVILNLHVTWRRRRASERLFCVCPIDNLTKQLSYKYISVVLPRLHARLICLGQS